MKGLKVGALILGLVAGLLSLSHAAAQQDSIVIGSATIEVGSSSSVALSAANIGEPGLAAWTIDVFYDPDVVVAVGCQPESFGVCNPNLAANTVRVTGASATGFEGDTPLASLTFKCLTEGTSALTIDSREFADGTLGRPQAIDVAAVNGSIQCEALPLPTDTPVDPTPVPPAIVSAGTGPGDLGIDNSSLIIAGLIGAGIAWLIVGVGGAGLTAVTASAVPWRRSPEPGGSIARSDVPTPAASTAPDDSRPTWLAAAQRRLSGSDATAIPAFRRSRRRE